MPPPFARTAALCDELEQAGIPMRRQVGIPAIYQGKPLPLGFCADILPDETVIPRLSSRDRHPETVILEIKAVPALLRAHDTNRPG